jgi:hypothetical protein
MRRMFMVLWILSWSVPSAMAQVSVGIGLPGVSIGINLPLFPELVPVPGYPVYYAPRVSGNYFFYDGMYWAYQEDNWYASSWYNGPWGLVAPDAVPLYVLRVPVRYYRQPPQYFGGWQSDEPPRWGEHWGHDWEQHRSGWDRWNRGSEPARAPLPVYQRQYSGDRYPPMEQQWALHGQKYRYQPRDPVVRERYQEQERAVQRAPMPAPQGRQGPPQERSPDQQHVPRANPTPPVQHQAPSQPPPRGGDDVQRSTPPNAPPHERGPAIQDQGRAHQPPPHPPQGAVHEQQSPRSGQQGHPQGRGEAQQGAGPGHGHGQGQGQGQGKDHEKADKHGQGDK